MDLVDYSTLVGYMSSQFSFLQNTDFFLRMIVACMCGAAIGYERSRRFKGAGLRTHIIVCCGAALMMIVSKYGFVDITALDGTTYAGVRGADASRIASQVVNGISFLGAGVIFKHGSSVRGLTTAAGIWAISGVGLAIGAGMYAVGIFCTILIACLQFIMHKHTFASENLVTSRIQFTIARNDRFQTALDHFFEEHHAQIYESKVTYSESGDVTYEMVIRSPSEITMKDVDAFLQSVAAVRCVDFMAIC